MHIKRIILFLLLPIFSGCQYGMHKEKITDKYFLTYEDNESDLSLSYDLDDGTYIGVVNNTIFAVGYNSNFIIVKNHPFVEPDSINRTVTNYYIVKIDKNISKYKVDENKIGPMNELNFNKKRKELKIPDNLDFTIDIDENK